MNLIVSTPNPPYYAVIFTSQLNSGNNCYDEMAKKMLGLARIQPGFLGVESARESIGITVSYWKNLESIQAWKANIDHQYAQQLGKEKWYSAYKVRISRVEKEYGIHC